MSLIRERLVQHTSPVRPSTFVLRGRVLPHSLIGSDKCCCEAHVVVSCHADSVATFSALVRRAAVHGNLAHFLRTLDDMAYPTNPFLFLPDAVFSAIRALSIEEVAFLRRDMRIIASYRMHLSPGFLLVSNLAETRLVELNRN
jgi:hypothetical protein